MAGNNKNEKVPGLFLTGCALWCHWSDWAAIVWCGHKSPIEHGLLPDYSLQRLQHKVAITLRLLDNSVSAVCRPPHYSRIQTQHWITLSSPAWALSPLCKPNRITTRGAKYGDRQRLSLLDVAACIGLGKDNCFRCFASLYQVFCLFVFQIFNTEWSLRIIFHHCKFFGIFNDFHFSRSSQTWDSLEGLAIRAYIKTY